MKSSQKKKKREKEVKKKIELRRADIRSKSKEEREKEREEYFIKRATNRLSGRTIRKVKPEGGDVVDQLARNLEILEALEKEKAAQNNPTPPAEEGGRLSASADVVFIPNPESNKVEEGNKPSDGSDYIHGPAPIV